MRLTPENSDETIVSALMTFGKNCEHYDPETGMVFEASPCSNGCGCLTAHGNAIKIDVISDRLHAAMLKMYRITPFVEVVGYTDDGEDYCENCDYEEE